jgi:hypothetical protein
MDTYSFANTIVLVNGIEIVGWDEGDDVIAIKKNAPPAAVKVGAGGDACAAISSDQSGTFTFKMKHTSPSNRYLQKLVNQAQNGNFVPIRVLFKDTARNDLGEGTDGIITGQPGISRGAGISTNEWEIFVERLDILLGVGSEEVNADV